MLETIDGKQITSIPHRADFDAAVQRLTDPVANAIRAYLDTVIDALPPDTKTGLRTFNSGHLGSKLSPWPEPLLRLYFLSREFLGTAAREADVQERAGLWFGLFIWERIMVRDELWAFYDPNLSVSDPNRDPSGKVYFEKAAEA